MKLKQLAKAIAVTVALSASSTASWAAQDLTTKAQVENKQERAHNTTREANFKAQEAELKKKKQSSLHCVTPFRSRPINYQLSSVKMKTNWPVLKKNCV